MITVPFRAVLLSLIALVAVGGMVATNDEVVNNSSKVSTGACTKSGVTVVVDFGSSSSLAPITKCVSQQNSRSSSGWQLLAAAGIQTTGTSEYPESFVCRLNDFPAVSEEDCLGTPGFTSGSWVYFYSKKGPLESDSNQQPAWQRSPVGSATRVPGCGDFEGWLFVKPRTDGKPVRQVPSATPKPLHCEQ